MRFPLLSITFLKNLCGKSAFSFLFTDISSMRRIFRKSHGDLSAGEELFFSVIGSDDKLTFLTESDGCAATLFARTEKAAREAAKGKKK